MQAILLYLLKAAICSGILFLYYHIALRNKRFHYYNRFYLLMSVALSLLLPLLNIELWQFNSSNRQVIHLMNVVTVNTTEIDVTGSSSIFSWNAGALLLYVVVTVLMLAAFVFSISKLYHYKRAFPAEKLNDILFINTDLEQAPFSFFNNLFWKNTLDITDAAGRQIFKHELTHIEQKHSWDKLFLRLTTMLFWMNPFYWLIQKELGLIHEFIADEKAIENRSAEAFAQVLLQSQYGKNIFSPAQSFNYSPIKRRLLMLTTSSKESYSYVRRMLALPLLAATVLLFAFKLKEKEQPTAHTHAPFTLLVDAGHGGDAAGVISADGIKEKDINLAIAKQVAALAPAYGVTVKMIRTDDVTMDPKARMDVIEKIQPDAFVSIHVNGTEEPQTSKQELEVYIPRNEVNNNYEKSRLLGSSLLQVAKADFPVKTSLLQHRDEGIYVIDHNPYPAVLVECGYINNAENVKLLTDAAKVEQLARDILQGVVAYANAAPQTTSVVITDTVGKTPLYIVDGKEVTPEIAKAIDANKIESINVLKGDTAVKQYGDKGKNGVVVITLKNTATAPSPSSDAIALTPKNADADGYNKSLKIVDGKIVSNEVLQKLEPNSIYSISVWKSDDAVKRWGERGRDGVIEIATRQAHDASTANSSNSTSSGTDNQDISDTTIKPESNAFQYDVDLTNPKFPGGIEGWQKYLQQNLKADVPTQHKAPTGTYTTVVSFMVDENGNVSEVKAVKDPGYGTAEEAVRVIKEGPKWIPAQLNGHPAKVMTKQAITFRIEEGH